VFDRFDIAYRQRVEDVIAALRAMSAARATVIRDGECTRRFFSLPLAPPD
jgi:hypothetical protein